MGQFVSIFGPHSGEGDSRGSNFGKPKFCMVATLEDWIAIADRLHPDSTRQPIYWQTD